MATPTAASITMAISWMMTFDRLFAKQNASTYIYIYIFIWMEYVWSLWSLYCDWIKNLTPSGLFVLEANLRWVFKYVESICSDSGHCFWVKMNINIYIYIHTFWYDIILLYRYLHYMIASIIIHIHYWGMFFCTCTYWTTSPRINSCYHPPPK